jgi:hypothetical protein
MSPRRRIQPRLCQADQIWRDGPLKLRVNNRDGWPCAGNKRIYYYYSCFMKNQLGSESWGAGR